GRHAHRLRPDPRRRVRAPRSRRRSGGRHADRARREPRDGHERGRPARDGGRARQDGCRRAQTGADPHRPSAARPGCAGGARAAVERLAAHLVRLQGRRRRQPPAHPGGREHQEHRDRRRRQGQDVELALAQLKARGPLKEETIRLAYADPEDIEKTLLGILGQLPAGIAPTVPSGPPPIAAPPFSALYGTAQAPGAPAPTPTLPAEILAKGITIRAHKPTNSIFIRHYEADLERIKKLIREKLDIPLPQVKIEARLNELNRTDFFALGVSWGGAALRRLTTGGDVLVGQGVSGQHNTAATVPPIIAPTG